MNLDRMKHLSGFNESVKPKKTLTEMENEALKFLISEEIQKMVKENHYISEFFQPKIDMDGPMLMPSGALVYKDNYTNEIFEANTEQRVTADKVVYPKGKLLSEEEKIEYLKNIQNSFQMKDVSKEAEKQQNLEAESQKKKADKEKENSEIEKSSLSDKETGDNQPYDGDAKMASEYTDDRGEEAKRTGQDHRKEEIKNFKYPDEIKKSIKKRISELNKAIEEYDEKGYNDKSLKPQAIDNLKKIDELLSDEDYESFVQAQVYYGTLMSPLTNLFPAKLIRFLHRSDGTTDKNVRKSKEPDNDVE